MARQSLYIDVAANAENALEPVGKLEVELVHHLLLKLALHARLLLLGLFLPPLDARLALLVLANSFDIHAHAEELAFNFVGRVVIGSGRRSDDGKELVLVTLEGEVPDEVGRIGPILDEPEHDETVSIAQGVEEARAHTQSRHQRGDA